MMITDAQAAQPAGDWTYKIQYGPEGEANYAWLYRGTEMVATMRTHHAATILALLDEREGREAQVAFTLSDASRLLRKQDVQGACPHPDDCFYESDRVRCGPCAVKASAAKGVEIDDTHSHLPEVCRLRREVKAAEAERDALRAERDAEADRRETSEAVVDRIWDIFGRPSYEELAGRSIYDLITEAKVEAVRLRQALEVIASQRSQIFSHGDMSNREAFSIASAALTKGTAE